MKVVPQCAYCKHLVRDLPRSLPCAAFPDGIPEDLYYNRRDHRKPYPGDQGIHWEPENEERGRQWEEAVRFWEETHGRKWGEPAPDEAAEED